MKWPFGLPILAPAAILGFFSILGTGLVALVHDRTEDRIAANERAVVLRTLAELLPSGEYDNDLVNDVISVTDPLLGTGRPSPAYRARRQGVPVAVVLSPTASDGYGGAIHLLVAVRSEGEIAGVRVVDHHETPGLGDPIELRKSDWILGFAGRSLQNPGEKRWAVKKDGGDFDQFTGATITPRAVVKAVRAALVFFQGHRQELFGPMP